MGAESCSAGGKRSGEGGLLKDVNVLNATELHVEKQLEEYIL